MGKNRDRIDALERQVKNLALELERVKMLGAKFRVGDRVWWERDLVGGIMCGVIERVEYADDIILYHGHSYGGLSTFRQPEEALYSDPFEIVGD
jgi:hypothetical protein